MKSEKSRSVAHALIWAATLIATALLTRESDNGLLLLLLLVSAWFTTAAPARRCEKQALARLLGRARPAVRPDPED
ncbi:MAG: hypothetical protein AAF184_13225 [Pseudomonadota bacterium]